MKALIAFSLLTLSLTAHANSASLSCTHTIKGENLLTVEQAERGSGYEYLVRNQNSQGDENLELTQFIHSEDVLHMGKLNVVENIEYMSFEDAQTGTHFVIDFLDRKIIAHDYAGEVLGVSGLECKVIK